MKTANPLCVLFTLLSMLMALLSFGQSQPGSPFEITIGRDGVLLKGKFHAAGGTSLLPTVLLLPGSPGNETDVLGIGKVLSDSGINTLTFNYSGTWKSEGKTSLDNSLMDVQAAYDFLHHPENINRFRIDTTFIILGGYSYGGGIAMTYAIKHPEIATVMSIAGVNWGEYFEEYIRNPDFKKTTDANMARMAALTEQVRFEKGAMPIEITQDGIIRLDSAFFLTQFAHHLAQRDILIIGGWDDPMATVDQYILPLYRALKKEKAQKVQIIAFQDGHSFSKSREQLASAISKWIKDTPERKKL